MRTDYRPVPRVMHTKRDPECLWFQFPILFFGQILPEAATANLDPAFDPLANLQLSSRSRRAGQARTASPRPADSISVGVKSYSLPQGTGSASRRGA